MSAYRHKLVIAYDGSAYGGWQIQPNSRTVQGELESVFRTLTNVEVKVHGSGRTDQGVHALGQVAHCDLPTAWTGDRLLNALNASLPRDIRILKATRAAETFHARRSAVRKEYRYCIWNAPVLLPHLRQYRAHIREPLNLGAMCAAAACLAGVHDFAAFTANPNREVDSTTRNLMKLTVTQKGHDWVIAAMSEGFLYKMVRSLAGFLIRVGSGAVPPQEAARILQSKERTARVPTAPPEGLFLWRVWY